ncbi:MAG: hypothetical protein ACAI38_13560 [Myxococcota bacterium]|nr:hypothetical protein [Myxococcota bacterium]
MNESTSTYIAVTVGAFRLALPAAAVHGVVTDVLNGEPTSFRGQRLPVIDLAAVFAGTRRLVAPFAVVTSARGDIVLVGVDRVGHEPLRGNPIAVPKLGLLRPDLFEGALRGPDGLTLILSPRSLIGL